MRRSTEAGALLVHPLVLGALALWALNDHWFKSVGGWLPGKLSDVACLIVIPVLVGGGVELAFGRRGGRWLFGAAALAALIMALINTWAPAAWAYEQGLGLMQWPFRGLASVIRGEGWPAHRPVVLTMDPTDLITLPAVLVPVWLERRRTGRRSVSSNAATTRSESLGS